MSFALTLLPDVVEAEAGATTPVGLSIVNRGAATDRFEVEVEGIDPEWRFIPVPTFSVEPGETRDEKLFLKPPRLPESVAGSYPFVVRVRSLESGESRTAQGLLKLKAFHHLTMDIAPKKGVVSPTTHRNDFRLTVVNLGNSEQTLQLSAQDPDDRCAYEFESDQIVLGPGQQREVEMVADPKQKPLLSSGRLIGFSTTARSLTDRAVTATAQAQLEQRSLLSPATLVAAVVLAGAFGGWWAMRPKPPTIQLQVVPMRAVQGDTVQIRWVSEHADHVKVTVGEETVYDGIPDAAPIPYVLKTSGSVPIVAEATRDNGRTETNDREDIQVDAPVVAPEAEIATFKASDRRVKLGSSFVLNWKVTNATRVEIAPLGGSVSPEQESQEVTPSTTGEQTYTLIAYNADNKVVKRSVKVTVYDESDAQILAFAANPPTAKEDDGGKVTVSWQVTGAVRVELKVGTNGSEAVETSGAREVALTTKTPIVLTAIDEKNRKVSRTIGVQYEKAIVTINPTDPNPPITTTGGGLPPDPNFPERIPPP